MAFHVKIEVSNGYRCGCCAYTWDYDSWVDTLEEALAQVPTELIDGEPHAFNGDAELASVEIIDGSTGEKAAWGKASWSQGYGRGSGYQYTKWTGYRPDTGGFEAVYKGRERTEETWEDLIAALASAHQAQELKKAERALAEAKAKIEQLG